MGFLAWFFLRGDRNHVRAGETQRGVSCSETDRAENQFCGYGNTFLDESRCSHRATSAAVLLSGIWWFQGEPTAFADVRP